MTSERAQQISDYVAAAQQRVAQAALAAGRQVGDVTIIGITKTYPASDVVELARHGVTNIGENKAQELRAKVSECMDRPEIVWHFVGQLQRNKARLVAGTATYVHSIDRPEIVSALDRHVAELESAPLKCLVQVNLDPTPRSDRGGIAPKGAVDLAELVADSPHLSLAGVMGVASQEIPARESFERLADVRASIAKDHPLATMMSAGMSIDFPDAIAAGATHVRLGAALLGERTYLR